MTVQSQRRRRKILRDLIESNHVTQAELAAKHGVSESTIAHDVEVVWAIIGDDLVDDPEQARRCYDLRVKQAQFLYGEAVMSWKSSKIAKVRCRSCVGRGRDKDGGECPECDGDGIRIERRPGDPRYLEAARRAWQDLCRLEGLMRREREDDDPGSDKRVVNIVGDSAVEKLISGDPELRDMVVRQRSLSFEIGRRLRNGRAPIEKENGDESDG